MSYYGYVIWVTFVENIKSKNIPIILGADVRPNYF